MIARLACVALACLAAPLRAGDADDALRLIADGEAAFVRAEAADALGDAERAKRELTAARVALAQAALRLCALAARGERGIDPDKRLRAIAEVGAACCGAPTLWGRHGVAPPLAERPPAR